MLAGYFLRRAATTYQKSITGFTADAITTLCQYGWPGNVRELENVIECAVLLCTSDVITTAHLSDLAVGDDRPRSFGTSIREEKVRRIQQALAQTHGNQAAAARLLGISRSNLARLMKSLGLKPPDIVH